MYYISPFHKGPPQVLKHKMCLNKIGKVYENKILIKFNKLKYLSNYVQSPRKLLPNIKINKPR